VRRLEEQKVRKEEGEKVGRAEGKRGRWERLRRQAAVLGFKFFVNELSMTV
jgi:hypothetical protein